MEKGPGSDDGIGENEGGFNDGKSSQFAAVTQHVEPDEGLLCVHSSSFLYRMAQLLRTYPSALGKINLLSVNLNLKNSPHNYQGLSRALFAPALFRARASKHV